MRHVPWAVGHELHYPRRTLRAHCLAPVLPHGVGSRPCSIECDASAARQHIVGLTKALSSAQVTVAKSFKGPIKFLFKKPGCGKGAHTLCLPFGDWQQQDRAGQDRRQPQHELARAVL